jgi:3-hydroxyisobutyrate dehydrogenase
MKHVALLGLGTMGSGMGQQLLKAGFELTVYNRTVEKAASFAAAGAKTATSPREAVHEADVIISIVSNDDASRQMWLGEQGALSGAKEGAVLVECSTLSPDWVRELAALAAAQQLAFLDVPVNGSRDAAATGNLLLLVGGPVEPMEQIRPVLEAIGRQLVHLGSVGSGTAMKLARNMLVAVQTLALGELLTLTQRAGLNMDQVTEILLNDGGLSNGLMKRNIPVMRQKAYDKPDFFLQHMRKDVSYALRLAGEVGAALPAAAATREVYQLAGNQGHDREEFAAVIEVLQ